MTNELDSDNIIYNEIQNDGIQWYSLILPGTIRRRLWHHTDTEGDMNFVSSFDIV